jgi:CheY-like chemotaxis protein
MPIRHVLVVDDSKSARLMLRKILQNLGMTVDTADSAEEALDYLRQKKPDVIFMDHTMPGMDGLTALRQIRSEPTTAAIPAAMYTSKDEPAFRNEAHAAGAVDVLSKPATPAALESLLERMNALLDAAVKPQAAPAPVSAGVTAEWVEKLFVEKTERAFYDAVESQVLPLINDVIAKLRLELELSQEEASTRSAAQVVEKRLADWQPPAPPVVDTQGAVEAALEARLPALLKEQFETFQREAQVEAERRVQELTKQLCQSQWRAFTEQLLPQLGQRITEMVRKAGVVTQESAVAAAREVAMTGAREVALQAVAEAHAASANVEETPAAAAMRVTRKMLAEAQGDWQRRIYLAAGGAALAGIGAALLVYGLK